MKEERFVAGEERRGETPPAFSGEAATLPMVPVHRYPLEVGPSRYYGTAFAQIPLRISLLDLLDTVLFMNNYIPFLYTNLNFLIMTIYASITGSSRKHGRAAWSYIHSEI